MNTSIYTTTRINPAEYADDLPTIDILDSHQFFSDGPSGRFEMRSFITVLKDADSNGLPNLGFGFWDEEKKQLDDTFRPRNGDMRQILGTVAKIAFDFLDSNPSQYLYAEGSTQARTRLYQREIIKVLYAIPPAFTLYGLLRDHDEGFVIFTPGVNYDGFLLSGRNC